MKKLNELTLDELKELIKNNRELEEKVYEEAYENNMFWQGEWSKEMLGKDKGIRYHDHYMSFYYTIDDVETFLNNIPDTCRDYLDEEGQKIYDEVMKLFDEWQNMTYDEQDENEELYEKIENGATELLYNIETALHQFETISDDDVEGILMCIADDMNYMGEWEVDNNRVVYQYITKTYK